MWQGRGIEEVKLRVLSELKPGERAYVRGIRSNGLMRRRLLDLGFVPGREVEAVLESPAGDPIAYRILGTVIALRAEDAFEVDIGPAPCPPASGLTSAECAEPTPADRLEAERQIHRDEDGMEPVIALAGNPNTGKSTVFNYLTGLRQHVGNWPGKTVTRTDGIWVHEGKRLRLVDLPGTYSLLSTSEEEEIARDYLVFGTPDCTVVVADATCLERNLNLVFQVLEITDRVVVCVNLMDQARNKGIRIDAKILEAELGVPVALVSARFGEGMEALEEKIQGVVADKIRTRPARVPYDSQLEKAIQDLVPDLQSVFPDLPNTRWIAMRLIDGGDKRLRREVESALLADRDGRIGTSSIQGGSPTANEIRR
jgi:ferrous iron transport protein B